MKKKGSGMMNMRKIIRREMKEGKEFFRIGEGGRIIVMTREELALWEKEQYGLHLENNSEMSFREFQIRNMENYGRLSELVKAFGLPAPSAPPGPCETCDTLFFLMADEKGTHAICFGVKSEIRDLIVEGVLAIMEKVKDMPTGEWKIHLFRKSELSRWKKKKKVEYIS